MVVLNVIQYISTANNCNVYIGSKAEGMDRSPLLPSVPNAHAVCRVKGPEPGYVATPIILVNAALALLANRSKLGPGGVWTAGALLKDTDLLERLQKHGIVFEMVEASASVGVTPPLTTPGMWGRACKAPSRT